MQNQNTRRGYTQEQNIIPKLQPLPLSRSLKSFSSMSNQAGSVSSTHAITQQQVWKTLKRVQGLSCFINRGFTLIELLVVVLIIGILAAVALPQYNKAVKKAQGREVLVALDVLDKGLHAYALEKGGISMNGTSLQDVITSSDLSIETPVLKYFKYGNGCGSPGTENFEGFSAGCPLKIYFRAKRGNEYVNVTWDNNTGFRNEGSYCNGANCKDYFNCTEQSEGYCATNTATATSEETCMGGGWSVITRCYLD